MSRMLEEIDTNIKNAPSEEIRAEWQAKRACYLVRVSRYAEARQLISWLRPRYRTGHVPTVLIWIMLAEGLLLMYEAMSIEAADRIQRAQLLAKAIGHKELLSNTSVWRALVEFNSSDFQRMAQSLRLAAENMGESRLVQSRVALIISQCYLLCGDWEAANRWGSMTQLNATKLGDQGTIEAMLYNRAAMHIGRLRAEACVRAIDESEVKAVEYELASARNYFRPTQHLETARLLDLCAARLLLLQKRFSEADEAMSVLRGGGAFPKWNFSPDLMDLERLYCVSRVHGAINESQLADAVDALALEELEVDERLVASWLIREIATVVSGGQHVSDAETRLAAFRQAYVATYSELRTELDRFERPEFLSFFTEAAA